MYKKQQKIQSSITNLSNYVEGFDVYNSWFLQKLGDQSLRREKYQITVYEYRPDLIAEDFYGDPNYMGILMSQIRIKLENLKRGVILELIPKEIIDNIISSM
jgi:hypothetical protein